MSKKSQHINYYINTLLIKFFSGKISYILILSGLFLTGCATVIKGPTERVTFTSEPTNAEIIINDSLRGQTPLQLNLYSDNDYSVRFKLDTSKAYKANIESSFASQYLIADICSGFTGVLVDLASQSWYELDKKNIHVVFNDTSAYEKDTISYNNDDFISDNDFRKKIILSLEYGIPLKYVDISGTYMFTENFGVSVGYLGMHNGLSDTNALFMGITTIDMVYTQLYIQNWLFYDIYSYFGVGFAYASYISKSNNPSEFFLPYTEKKGRTILPYIRLGAKYKITKKISVSFSLLPTIGLGINFVF